MREKDKDRGGASCYVSGCALCWLLCIRMCTVLVAMYQDVHCAGVNVLIWYTVLTSGELASNVQTFPSNERT